MSITSDRLKEAISIRGLRQIDIINSTGISKGALSSYLAGRYAPKQNNIYLLAKCLNVNEAWLMGYDVSMDKTSAPVATSQQVLTAHEQSLISAYRSAPDGIKDSVCKLLDVKREENTEILGA